jgi:DNA invertase Pin-like site-specific DNA recombinase
MTVIKSDDLTLSGTKVPARRFVRPQGRQTSVKIHRLRERTKNIALSSAASVSPAAPSAVLRPAQIHIYTRVSSEEQARPYHTSLADQERMVREAIARFGVAQDIVVWEEPGHSGKSPIATRPIGRRMLANIQSGDTVAVSRVDRLSRQTSSGVHQVETWRNQGVKVLMLDLPLPPSGDWTAALEFSFHLFVAAAQFEHGRIRERTMGGKAAKIALGQYPHGSAPFGWMIELRGPGGRERYKVENPQEQAALRRAYQLWDEQLRQTEILRILAREGHRNRRGGFIGQNTLYRWCCAPERANLSERSRLALLRRKTSSDRRRGSNFTPQQAAEGPVMSVKKAAERAERVLPFIDYLISRGANSYRRLADQLNLHGVPAFRGGRWYPASVRNAMPAAGRQWGQIAETAPPGDFANITEFPRFARPDRREREAARVKYRLDEALPPKRRGRVQKLVPDILALHDRGVVNERIARLLGVHLNSVEAVLRKFADTERHAARPASLVMAAATLPLLADAEDVERANRIITARLTGATGQSIARELGIAPKEVYETLRRAKRINADLALQRAPVTAAQRAAIVARRAQGGVAATPAAIAAALELGEHTVRRVVNEAAIDNPALAFRLPPITAELAAEMAAAVAQGAALGDLVEEYGYAHAKIRAALRMAAEPDVKTWLDSNCRRDPAGVVSIERLYASFRSWTVVAGRICPSSQIFIWTVRRLLDPQDRWGPHGGKLSGIVIEETR